jgi:transcriptional regulator GlxA family with amidase domain
MRIAILTFDGFNEIDSLVSFHILNRMRPHGWRAEIVGPTHTVTSTNGVVLHTQNPLASVPSADVVLFGSGIGGREASRDPELLARIVVDPDVQLVGAQCSGTLMMSTLGLLEGLPVCTDLGTKPWVIESGLEVLDQPFVAHGSRATAGGCLSSTYLSAWVIASLAGCDRAAEILQTVAPVGERTFVDHAMSIIGPFLATAGISGHKIDLSSDPAFRHSP